MLPLLPLTMLLTACVTASSNPPIVVGCPILREYTAEQQQVAAKEFDEIRARYPQITRYVIDYADLRRKVRICQGIQ